MKISRRTFLRLAVLGVLGGVGLKGFINSRYLKLERLDIQLKNLPSGFDGLKVGFITDIHAGPLVPTRLVRAGVEMVMAEKPDLILLGGDYVHGATRFLWTRVGGFKPAHFNECLDELSALSAPLGVYGVMGNHDHWSGAEVLESIASGLEGIGVRILKNESEILKAGDAEIVLAGVDDYWEGPADLVRAFKGAGPERVSILLSHNPDINEDVENLDRPIDLILSGHTHGGQIVLPLVGLPFPAPFNTRYTAGLVRDGDRQTYVNRGLGVFFVPIRIGCPPEVSLLTLRRKA